MFRPVGQKSRRGEYATFGYNTTCFFGSNDDIGGDGGLCHRNEDEYGAGCAGQTLAE